MYLPWTTEKPTVRGLYWRRNGKGQEATLMFVFEGPDGLYARIVDEQNPLGASSEPFEKAVEEFAFGEWAGPLGLETR